jgi:Fibronectin type III domain
VQKSVLLQPWRRRLARPGIVAGAVCSVVLTTALAAGVSVASPALAATAPSLMPAAGQFVSVPIVRALDTRYGTGGVPSASVPANGTVTFPVAGVFGVPADAQSVVLDINALSPAAKGYLTVYDPDAGDPGVASVGLRAGTGTNQTATVPVSSAGTVAITNHSSGPTNLTASVVGYYTGSSDAAGDTYSGVGWGSPVANTTTGWNVSQTPIPAGGSLTVQVGGVSGIAPGADTAVLQVNALNATAGGFLTTYAAGSPDPGVSALAYFSDTSYRNVLYVPLSSSGQATLTNHGAAPVDVTVYARGYYMPPSTIAAGSAYQPSPSVQMVYGFAVAAARLPSEASATFQVTGTGNIPASGVSGVTEDVVVGNPTARGRLDEGSVSGALQPVVNFLPGDTAYAGYDNGIVSTLSPTGQETITNDSAGTADIQVDVTGWYVEPVAPDAPQSVSVAVTGQSAAVSWSPPDTDGGSPITGYTVTATPDGASVTVGGGSGQVTLTGLANPAGDTFTVTAANAAGVSPGAVASSPATKQARPHRARA